MADRVGIDLIRRARDPNGPGGEKFTWWRELRLIRNELTKPEGDKPAGRLSRIGLEAILGIGLDEATGYARSNLERLRAEAPRLLWSPQNPAGAIALTPAHASLPVFINADGWPVPRADVVGQPRDLRTLLAGVYGLEEAIRRQLRISRHSLPSLLAMTTEVKAKMIDALIAAADMRRNAGPDGALPGLSLDETMELRSSAFTDLMALVTTIDRNAAGGARLIDRVHRTLVEMAEGEPDRWLGDHMIRMLSHPAYLEKLSDDAKAMVGGVKVSADGLRLFEARHRQKFPMKNITDENGFVRWEHVCGEGEGFFESYKYTIQKHAIHGAKFKVVPGSETWNAFDVELVFPAPRIVDGKELKGIRMHVRRFANDMFSAIGKNIGTPEQPVYQGFSYGGHSQIGENQERSLRNAIAQGIKAKVPQIGVLDLCAGLDNLDADLKALGDIDLMTTHDSSYFSKGQVRDPNTNEVKVEEGVTRSEGQDILVQLLTGLTAGENYREIHGRFKRTIPEWNHEEAPNTHMPTLENYLQVLTFHLDADGDGVMDARDIHFHCGLKSVPSDFANEFMLKGLPDGLRFDRIKGSAALNAVLDLNVATHYNPFVQRRPIVHKFVADGFFDGEGQKDLIRFNVDEVYNGTKGILVQYNSRLGHATREALEALTMYMSMMALADGTLKGRDGQAVSVSGLDEVDRKLMALTFAVFRLNYDGEGRANDERIWKQLLKAARLPENMPYGTLANILGAEHHDYSGNLEIVRRYKQGLPADVLAALARREVGRPEADPPPPVGPNPNAPLPPIA